MARPSSARDIALGLVATGVRAGAATGRIVLLPVRIVAGAPVVGSVLRRAGEGLAAEGSSAREQGRQRLEAAAGEVLTSPELERTVDRALAGPLTDAVGRSVAEHRVTERLAAEIVATPEFEQAVADALEHEATRRLVDRALASPGLERLVADALESRLAADATDRMLESPELQRVVGHVASSPEVRAALTRQTTSLAEDMVGGIRRGAEHADDDAERRVRRWLRRPARPAERAQTPFAGVFTRAVALTLDVLIAQAIFLVGAAMVGLVASLVGELRPVWLVNVLAAASWLLVTGTYFVVFWAVAGQTPGMRLMHLRVSDGRGGPPGPARSAVRFVGLLLAIVPLFAGFVPVLFDERRRGLPDFLAGTTVLYADSAAPLAEPRQAAEAGIAARAGSG